MYDRNYTPVGLPFENDMIKLAKFLRANFPDAVAENERMPLSQSGAVELAIDLLTKFQERLTKRALDGVVCPACKSTNAFNAVICVDCGAHTAPRQ